MVVIFEIFVPFSITKLNTSESTNQCLEFCVLDDDVDEDSILTVLSILLVFYLSEL